MPCVLTPLGQYACGALSSLVKINRSFTRRWRVILDKIPDGENFFNAVIIPCFTQEGHVVLLRKRLSHPIYPGLWGFPAGKVRAGESFQEAAQREIWEETGNRIPLDFIEHTGIVLPARHRRLSGEDFYFMAHTLKLRTGIYLHDIAIDRREHACYKLERPEKIITGSDGNLIPDARETFRMFCEFKGIIAKAT